MRRGEWGVVGEIERKRFVGHLYGPTTATDGERAGKFGGGGGGGGGQGGRQKLCRTLDNGSGMMYECSSHRTVTSDQEIYLYQNKI